MAKRGLGETSIMWLIINHWLDDYLITDQELFRKILDHRGILFGDPVSALARLQLARAYVLMADNARAKTAYQDFLTPWKDADLDIPILKQAQAEYAKPAVNGNPLCADSSRCTKKN